MDIPKFRSVEEIKRWVGETQQQVRENTTLVQNLVKKLAAKCGAPTKMSAAEFRILDINKGSGALRKRTINLEFPIVKVPNADLLKNHYAVAERLSEQYKYILNTENEIRMNFKGATVKNATTESYKEVMGAIQKLKADLETTLRTVFHSLANIAQGHAPAEYLKFMEMLTETLSKNTHLEAESAKSMTYAALDKQGELIFAGYIILQNAVNDQGKVLPHLYIAVKWTVGGDVEIFVESEFVAPTLLIEGTVVENMKEAVKAVERQLALEGFSSQLGQLPVDVQLKTPAGGISRDVFTAKEYIKEVKAERDELIFVLTTTDPEIVDQVKTHLYLEVKALVKKKRSTTVRMRQSGNVLTFTFSNLDHAGGIHPIDLEWLEDKYKLNPTELRKISNIING